MKEINLDDPRIMSASEAAKRWRLNDSRLRQKIEDFPKGSIRKFGKQWVVTQEGMEKVFGKPKEEKRMKVGFQHPDYGIPCIGEWDEEGQTLMFDIEDHDEAIQWNSEEDVEDVIKWCMRNSINCENENRGNDHLMYLGIKERLEDL